MLVASLRSSQLKQLYNMSWPVLPNEYEMEEFEAANRDIRKRIGLARGTIKTSILEGEEKVRACEEHGYRGLSPGLLYCRYILTRRFAPFLGSPRSSQKEEYALGETPKQPRTGGRVEPGFYGINRMDSPVRLPGSHYSFWQQHEEKAPKVVEMGLGVMSFVLPESPGDDGVSEFLQKHAELEMSEREEKKGETEVTRGEMRHYPPCNEGYSSF